MAQQKRRDASFVVRIWWEDRNRAVTGSPVWRGQVQHAVSGESVGFHSVGELWDFLRRWTGAYLERENGCSDDLDQ